MTDTGNTGLEFKYLIVNDRDRKFGLWVNTVGYQSIPPGVSYPLREHPSGYFFNAEKGRILREYQLVYIADGQGTFASESTSEKRISKGHLMVLFPGQWHTYRPLKETGWTEYYIGFEGHVIDRLIAESFLTREQQILEIGINSELTSLFARAIKIAEADRIASQQYLSGIVFHMIGLVLSVSKNKMFEVSDMSSKIEQAKIIMNENIASNLEPEDLAMKLNISYSWFRRIFKEYTGYAPAKYFQELKLRKAKQLLIDTPLSVKEISFSLGFQSTEYFFMFFKKHTGFTPLGYRAFGKGEQEQKQQ